jgi:hypothetical protein
MPRPHFCRNLFVIFLHKGVTNAFLLSIKTDAPEASIGP